MGNWPPRFGTLGSWRRIVVMSSSLAVMNCTKARFGKVARFDLSSFSQVQVLDLTATDTDLKGFLGGFASGDHGYVVPYDNGKVARFDLSTFTNVQVLDLINKFWRRQITKSVFKIQCLKLPPHPTLNIYNELT